MAGFDFDFACTDRHRPLGSALLRRLQALSRGFGLQFRYSKGDGGWYVKVDGPLINMQGLIADLHSLIYFAEGQLQPPRIAERRTIARRLMQACALGVLRMHDAEADVFGMLGISHHSYFFDVGPLTHLGGHFRELQQSLMQFHAGRIAPSALAEELHTACEALFRAVLPRDARRGSFAQLLERVAGGAGLHPDLQAAILRLKSARRDAKHRVRRVTYDELVADLSKMIAGIQHILKHGRDARASEAV